ncbi:MAG: DnaD domain protein [Bacillota bacterium]|nr:DnaD domain protein [Bacillota bacterium]
MGIKINLGAWNSVFAVPAQVVDNDLKLAGTFQLKVLLYLLRHSGESISAEDISKSLSIPVNDVKDSLLFWVQRELITMSEDILLPAETKKTVITFDKEQTISSAEIHSDIEHKTNKIRLPVRPQRPEPDFVAKRMSESEELSFLMQEAQIILGRLISNGEISTLLMLHDNDGLPVDVILMLLEFCKSKGKKNMAYIEKVGIGWAESEIFTVQKAEEKIREINKNQDTSNKVNRLFGISTSGAPTKNQIECANRWVNIWGYSDDMLLEAYERCIESKGEYKLSYIDGIIKKWQSKGIFTVEDLEASKQKKVSKQVQETSYDIEEYESSSIFD